MRWLTEQLAHLVGTTFEDWLLTAMILATVALVVIGVRGCADDHARDARAAAAQTR